MAPAHLQIRRVIRHTFSITWKVRFITLTLSYGYRSIAHTRQCDRRVLELFQCGISKSNWKRLCCHCAVFYEIRRYFHLFKRVFATKGDEIRKAQVVRIVLDRTHETQGGAVQGQQYNHMPINQELSQLSLVSSIKGYIRKVLTKKRSYNNGVIATCYTHRT